MYIAKPVLDVIIYNAKLSQNVGAEGLIALTAIVQVYSPSRRCSSAA
jgi:ATP-binding cassette subfamily D (ALD) long-chain fatty acid import protein